MSVISPQAAGTRQFAQELFAQISDDLTDVRLRVELTSVRIASPSFVDEIIRIAFEERAVGTLEFIDTPLIAANAIDDSATDRGLADRISVDRRAAAS